MHPYRILWIWSSQKQEQDRAIRQACIQRAIEGLEDLRGRIDSPRSRLRTKTQIEQAAATILEESHAARWMMTEIRVREEHHYKQATAGRPSAGTQYVRATKERFEVHWQSDAETFQYDDRTDGIFPLITNDPKMTLRETLVAYKHQPVLEKRHEQFKAVYEVMPVNLKSEMRIEAFLFVYFIAILIESLIERAIRRQMKTDGIASLPLYPEQRQCSAPTANRIFDVFADVRRHRLVDADGVVRQRFYDELTSLQRTVLRLLGLSPGTYFSAGDDPPPPHDAPR